MEPSKGPKSAIVFPALIVAVGLGWLLTAVGIVPEVNWAWVLALGGAGVLILAVSRLDQVTIIVGPFLIVASVMSVLRQTGRLSPDVEVPALVIVVGVLMLVGRIKNLPEPTARASDSEQE